MLYRMLYLQNHLMIGCTTLSLESQKDKKQLWCFSFQPVVLKQSDPDDMHTLDAVRFFSSERRKTTNERHGPELPLSGDESLSVCQICLLMFFLHLFDMEKDYAQTKSAGLCSLEDKVSSSSAFYKDCYYNRSKQHRGSEASC